MYPTYTEKFERNERDMLSSVLDLSGDLINYIVMFVMQLSSVAK